jgi:hypothetical protein
MLETSKGVLDFPFAILYSIDFFSPMLSKGKFSAYIFECSQVEKTHRVLATYATTIMHSNFYLDLLFD